MIFPEAMQTWSLSHIKSSSRLSKPWLSRLALQKCNKLCSVKRLSFHWRTGQVIWQWEGQTAKRWSKWSKHLVILTSFSLVTTVKPVRSTPPAPGALYHTHWSQLHRGCSLCPVQKKGNRKNYPTPSASTPPTTTSQPVRMCIFRSQASCTAAGGHEELSMANWQWQCIRQWKGKEPG